LFIVDTVFNGCPFEVISKFVAGYSDAFIVIRYTTDVAGGCLVEKNINTFVFQLLNKFLC